MTNCQTFPAPDYCPDADQITPQVMALLPRGRAWGTHDGGPWSDTVLYKFCRAVATVLAYANERLCKARLEFFCATADETLDDWLADYGLPDACDPFPDLCTKVGALGSQRCEYFKAVAASRGWAIDCIDFAGRCGAQAGCSRATVIASAATDKTPRVGQFRAGKKLGCAAMPARSGKARAGARDVNVLLIRVYTNSSSAYVAPAVVKRRAGRMRAAQRLSCVPNAIATLQCLIERITPAHALVQYQTV